MYTDTHECIMWRQDAKIRTFIQEDANRQHLTLHAYDLHYGTIRADEDVVQGVHHVC